MWRREVHGWGFVHSDWPFVPVTDEGLLPSWLSWCRDHFGLDDPEAVLSAVYTGTLSYGRLFELARVCVEAAAAGDPVASGAVTVLADEVVAMVVSTAVRLGVVDEEVDTVLGGGLFESDYPGFGARIEAAVRAEIPKVAFRRLEAPPVLGAALLALDLAGSSPEDETRLRQTAR